jgi:hypothetical protein
MGACTLVNEPNGVVNGVVHVNFRVEIPVRSAAITDDRSAGFDSSIYKAIRVSAVLSGTGTRNVLPDSRSILGPLFC